MSKTLERLLTGVLTGASVQLRACEEGAQDEVTVVLQKLPMPLSKRQQQAIRNAWSSDLSYIQGPPGTGKSHTIAALMLSAVLMQRRLLLVSHKKAAIDVVRDKLVEVLGEDLPIYVGSDVQRRAASRARIQALISDVQGYGAKQHLAQIRFREEQVLGSLEQTLRRYELRRKALIEALDRSNAVFNKYQEHLRARRLYSDSYGPGDLTPDALGQTAEVSESWGRTLDRVAEIQLRRTAGTAVTKGELLGLRVAQAGYARRFAAGWLSECPWDVDRLLQHHKAVAAFDAARREQARIKTDLNPLRASLRESEREIEEQAKTYIRTLFLRTQLERAAACVPDLTNFAALFRLRAPRLLRPRMDAIDYRKITSVFPLWLGEMRHLGSVLPFQEGIFDLAVVDEASQVNIAEVVPAFYRADSFVVVGDRNQLGLEAAGLFAINRTFEELTWNNAFGGVGGVISYNAALQRELAVSKSSILDFIVSPSNGLSIPKATLDEHFRSMPRLAQFTSDEFYKEEGGLKVMTEVGENLGKACFQLVEVGGVRAPDGKYVPQEVDKAIEIVGNIASGRELGNGSALRQLGFQAPDRFPRVGVISFTTTQRDQLRLRADEVLDEAARNRVHLFIGTPEEFQGNERDVIVLTFALGEGQRYAVSHYERPNRFNVATSRARKFTYAVIGRCPHNAPMLRRYFSGFGFRPAIVEADTDLPATPAEQTSATAHLSWRFDERLCESEFEVLLMNCLRVFIEKHNNRRLKLFNQVNTCGQKRLDFVLFDEATGRSVAVEVDGPDHFCADGMTYHQEHMDRVAVLRRAGWRIVHVPFFRWYRNGWIYDRDDAEFEDVLAQLYEDLGAALELETGRRSRFAVASR